MTDRYYPKFIVPHDPDWWNTTYDLMNQMETKERSNYPPGYSGHEHGKKFKFGYATCAPDPLPSAPIDPEAPDVNMPIGKHIWVQPLPTDTIKLPPKPLAVDVVKPQPMMQTLKNQDMNKPHSFSTDEDDKNLSFKCKTSAYLDSKAVTVDKAIPYTAAILGTGTGFSADGTINPVLPTGPSATSTTTAEAFPVPVGVRRGLEYLQYGREKAA